MENKYQTGFTLIEILIVITIILVLAGLSVGILMHINYKQRVKITRMEIVSLGVHCEEYKEMNGGIWPPDDPNTWSSRPLVKALQGDPATNQPQIHRFPEKRIQNGEYISRFGKPFFYRENELKNPKPLDAHRLFSFDIWTDDLKDGTINNWD